VLFVAVGAPIVEELFFRGLVLRSLERRFGSTWAVALSSVLFGLAHPQPLPAKALVLVMVSLAALGALLATLAVRTGRLGPSIVTHAVFNGWTVLFLVLR
jgi:membrane protease YdiL (CAAX protease family)